MLSKSYPHYPQVYPQEKRGISPVNRGLTGDIVKTLLKYATMQISTNSLQNTVCKLYLRGENPFLYCGIVQVTIHTQKTVIFNLPSKAECLSGK